MGELLTFPDVEALLVAYLDSVLVEPVSTSVPAQRPAAFVVLRRVGGVRRALTIDAATVQVEAWAVTETAAATLAATIRAHLHAAEDLAGHTVTVDEFAGLANFPDPLSGQSRYTATYQVTTSI